MVGRQYAFSTRTGDVNESNYWGILGIRMRFLHNNRIPAPDDKINTQSQCVGTVMADLYHLLRWVRIMDVVWGIFELVPNGVVQWNYIITERNYIAPDCI